MKRTIPLFIIAVTATLFGATAHKWASPVAEIRNASITLHDGGLVSELSLKNVTAEVSPGAHGAVVRNTFSY